MSAMRLYSEQIRLEKMNPYSSGSLKVSDEYTKQAKKVQKLTDALVAKRSRLDTLKAFSLNKPFEKLAVVPRQYPGKVEATK